MPYRIIVADKDPVSLTVLTGLFETEDFQLVGVCSAGELKQAIKARKPDIIILNSILQDTSSPHAVHKIISGIKTSQGYHDVTVLLMSGDPGSQVFGKLEVAGADGYINKPIDGSVLRKTVESILRIAPKNTLENGDDEIIIDFEDDVAEGLETESLEMRKDSESTAAGEVHVNDVSETGLVPLFEESGLQQIPGIDNVVEDKFVLNIGDMELEQYGDSVPWLDRQGERFTGEPFTGSTDNTQDLPPLELESILDFHDSVSGTSEETTGKTVEEGVHANSGELSLVLDSDSPPFPLLKNGRPHDLLSDVGFPVDPQKDLLKDVRIMISDAVPSRDEISSLLGQHITSIMPTKEEVLSSFRTTLRGRIDDAFMARESSNGATGITTQTGEISGTEQTSLLEKEYSEHEVAATIGSVNRKSPTTTPVPANFDRSVIEDYIKSLVPGRDEIMGLISAEIEQKLVAVIEKVIREQIEKITSNISP
ncbi:MAG: response regulator [Deltaproteobacteria bacterium]|nr:response regulator [Deltaproteobacteria bacterium]